MDNVVGVIFYLLIGIVLLGANVWFLGVLRQAVFGREFVIAPFVIIGREDDGGRLGASLAHMLRAQLARVQRELATSQQSLVSPGSEADGASDEDDPRALVLRFRSVSIPTAVLEPANIDVKVGGVEVGGVLAWAQRVLARPRTISFSVYYRGEKSAVVTGNLQSYPELGQGDLWIETDPGADEIATTLAFALVQRRLSGPEVPAIEALEFGEFRSLLTIVFDIARLNRKIASGRSGADGFAEVLPALEGISSKVPEWHELTYLTADVAETAGEKEKALALYRKLQQASQKGDRRSVSEDIVAKVEKKLRAPIPSGQPAAPEELFVTKAQRYAHKLGLKTPDPGIAFVEPKQPGVVAFWNEEQKRYEVNPKVADTPGLPEYVALMGRFMAKHFGRCNKRTWTAKETDFWNDLRSSAAEYIIRGEVGQRTDARADGMQVFRVLQGLETATGNSGAVRTLALWLLDNYDCNWTADVLGDKIIAFNDAQHLLPPDAVESAIRPAEGVRSSR